MCATPWGGWFGAGVLGVFAPVRFTTDRKMYTYLFDLRASAVLASHLKRHKAPRIRYFGSISGVEQMIRHICAVGIVFEQLFEAH